MMIIVEFIIINTIITIIIIIAIRNFIEITSIIIANYFQQRRLHHRQ